MNVPTEDHRNSPDINQYHYTKNFAQALMNFALILANVNQLKYLLETRERPLFYLSLSFIIASFVIQIFVKIGLMINFRYNMNNHAEVRKALRMNNIVTIAILLVTLINVAISAVILVEMHFWYAIENSNASA